MIHVGAAAPALPPALVDQLAPGGKMVIPVGPGESSSETCVTMQETPTICLTERMWTLHVWLDGGNQQIMAVTRAVDGRDVTTEPLLGVRYIPLTTPEKQLARK